MLKDSVITSEKRPYDACILTEFYCVRFSHQHNSAEKGQNPHSHQKQSLQWCDSEQIQSPARQNRSENYLMIIKRNYADKLIITIITASVQLGLCPEHATFPTSSPHQCQQQQSLVQHWVSGSFRPFAGLRYCVIYPWPGYGMTLGIGSKHTNGA